MTRYRSRRWLLGASLALGSVGVAAWLLRRPQSAPSPLHTTSLGALQIRARDSWGAQPPNFDAHVEHGRFDPVLNRGGWREYEQPLEEVLRTLVVHHSALPVNDGPREIQRLHQHDKGYADIGYHFVIDPIGVVFEGRAIGVRGAHVGGFNTGSVGVCLLGNFERIEPTAQQLASLDRLASALRLAYRITHLAGHRDFQPDQTVCPGANLAPLLPTLASKVSLAYGSGGYHTS